MLSLLLFPILHSVLLPLEDMVLIEEKQEMEHIEVATTTEIKWQDDTLKRICACESRGNPNADPTHYAPDGSVLRGHINNLDVGMCQINLKYHEETAKRFGLDLFNEHDNIAYATWLYKEQGTQPWVWSRPCWGK